MACPDWGFGAGHLPRPQKAYTLWQRLHRDYTHGSSRNFLHDAPAIAIHSRTCRKRSWPRENLKAGPHEDTVRRFGVLCILLFARAQSRPWLPEVTVAEGRLSPFPRRPEPQSSASRLSAPRSYTETYVP